MEFPTSEEICEALVRHVEMTGEEVFQKMFIKDGRVQCVVFCMIGPNSEEFTIAVEKLLDMMGFTESDHGSRR